MSIGPLQILLICVVVLLLFGAGKIPRLMGDLARGINAYKKGLKEGEGEDGSPSGAVLERNTTGTPVEKDVSS